MIFGVDHCIETVVLCSVLGPGLYNPKLRVHRGNMMINQDKRFKESYADTPGPGTYEVCI